MKKYIIRKRHSDFYVDRWGGIRQDAVQAMAFPSVEDADFHRGQLRGSPDQYEICELTADGQLIPVEVP